MNACIHVCITQTLFCMHLPCHFAIDGDVSLALNPALLFGMVELWLGPPSVHLSGRHWMCVLPCGAWG